MGIICYSEATNSLHLDRSGRKQQLQKLRTQSRCTKLNSSTKKPHAGCKRFVLVLVY